MKKARILMLSLLICFGLSLSLAAADNDLCLECHSDPDLTAERQGREISIFVDQKRFQSSVHHALECVDCHMDADVDEFPHPENLDKISCGMCHDEAEEAFMDGIHGRALIVK